MKSPPPTVINAAIILKKKSVHADHSGVCDIFSAERKKRGIALSSCAICPKIRFESLHDPEKNAFITIEEE